MANTDIADLSPLVALPLNTLLASGCQISDVAPIASLPTPGYIDLRENAIVDLAPLLAATWLVPDDSCGTLELAANPLSPASLAVVAELCVDTKVGVFADGATCEGFIPCLMP